jgi:1-acyl-sn-glycerol-3-phosphate acyltransferase
MSTSRVPDLPPEIPRRGGRLTQALGNMLLASRGWRIEGNLPPISKMVIIAGPHTSAWDLGVALSSEMAMRLDVSFFAKHSLFFWPFGSLLRAFGGIPVDRRANHDIVEQMAQRFEESDALILALAPEGTRQRVEQWKTGFYHIARRADVPIVPAVIDFEQRTVRFGPPVHPRGDQEAEVRELRGHFDGAVGKRPDLV